MKQSRTQIFFLPAEASVLRAFHTGVSLHSHTEHSQEKLAELPRHLERMPVVAQFLQWERKRYYAETGRTIDFTRAYWRGPLSARSAFDLERIQMERLGLRAMVSLTDHDDIGGPLLLHSFGLQAEVPISVEWTVPFEQTYFHIGIHNLPRELATCYMQAMAAYTRDPQPSLLAELFEMLHADPGVLIVFNHPVWDMKGIGEPVFFNSLKHFLGAHGTRIHALEINGLRSWQDNLSAISLAQTFGHPVVAGGDRHGLEPNALINLSRAASFGEFVEEIRASRSSDIAILPQYREPLALRHLRCAWDAVREHPTFAERERWEARVFVKGVDGIERPISALWHHGNKPRWIDPCLNVIGLPASSPIRAAGRLAYPAVESVIP